MKKRIYTIACLTLLLIVQTISAQNFRTESFSERIRTLRISVVDDWQSPPIIELNSNNQIEISFDMLGAAPETYTYTITHCDADWSPSQLMQSEYMRGFQHNPILDYANSFNTKMNYVNYKLYLPNENTDFLVSGNYVVQIFSDQDQTQPVLNACLSLFERKSEIQMKVSTVTDKGSNTKFQAVNLEINYGNEIRSPMQDLKVYVSQNNRSDNQASLVKPLSIQSGKAVYNHNPALIFDAGNEYRSFEMTTTQFTGLHVAAIEYHSPYFHTILKPDVVRSHLPYTFYEDINGRIFIRNIDADDSDIEADYQFVHFFIPCEQAFLENVYILSEAFNTILDARSQMEYNRQLGGYTKSVLLKEGYYNYLYVTKKNAASPATTDLIEGNFFQTENEYRIMVYARTPGMHYDKLIGVQTLQFK
jgi:hypothetical protein